MMKKRGEVQLNPMPLSWTGARRVTQTPTSNTLQGRRDDLLDHLEDLLQGDDRVRAVWLGGSFGRGTADAWSDLDLYSAIRDEDFSSWLAEHEGLYREVGTPVLVGPQTAPFASLEGVSQSILFAGPVAVDWEVYPLSIALRHPDTLVLFEKTAVPVQSLPIPDRQELEARIEQDLGFFWAMVPIALKYAGRGQTHRAVSQIDLLSETYVRLWRLVHDPVRLGAGGAHWLHPVADAALVSRLPRLSRVIDGRNALDVIRRLISEVMWLQASVNPSTVEKFRAAVNEVERFGDQVARQIGTPQEGKS